MRLWRDSWTGQDVISLQLCAERDCTPIKESHKINKIVILNTVIRTH